MNELKTSIEDFCHALKQYRLWLYLAQVEVKQKYKRSTIGPWWITISMVIFILAMSIVFSKIFKENLSTYLINFTAGFIFWTFFATTINESAETFRSNAGFIKQINLPQSIYIFKHIARQIIILAHNMVVYGIVCVVFQFQPGLPGFLFIPGFILFLINILWINVIISLICTRFRDMVPILNSCIQIAFFVTPISWSSNQISSDSLVIKLNPLVYLIDIVRAPLIGQLPMANSWIIMSTTAFIGTVLAVRLFSSKRHLIPYWIN